MKNKRVHTSFILHVHLIYYWQAVVSIKGQIKPKADCHDRKYLELEISISSCKYFRTVKKNKFVRSVFGRIYGAPICLQFYLTFST